MKQLYHFDEVFDSQKSFRIVLEAMSNPLRKLSLEKEKDKLYGEYPHILVIAMTLLDNETTYCVVEEKELSEQIKLLTNAKEVQLENAEYIFVLDDKYLDIVISSAMCGTLINPHYSATIIIDDSSANEKNYTLWGPGIKNRIKDYLTKTEAKAIRLRDQQVYEYPQGIDYMFLTKNGTIRSIPRLVKMEE